MVISTIEQLREKIMEYKSVNFYGIKNESNLNDKDFFSVDSNILVSMLDAFIVPYKDNIQEMPEEFDLDIRSMIGSIPSVENIIEDVYKKIN